MNQKTFRQSDKLVPAEPEMSDEHSKLASNSPKQLMVREKQKKRKPLEQRNVYLPKGFRTSAEDEDDESSGGTGAPFPESGEAGTPLPEGEYYEIHELIRSKHKGKVEAGRKFHERLAQENGQTAEFNDDMHPIAAMAYFSGVDNEKESPIPGINTDEEIIEELKFRKRLQLQKQLGLDNAHTSTPRPPGM
ncbi:MAG: hypothetical protein HKM04_01330 [Legionellales bacterium]|nr:hypothetical protein [Legionellales bacterium]